MLKVEDAIHDEKMTHENKPHDGKKTVKCRKCGLVSQSGTRFCPSCGAKIDAPHLPNVKPSSSLAFLHFTGGAYLIITAILNSLVQVSLLFFIPYILIGALSLFVGWQFYNSKLIKGWTKSLSVIVVVVGTIITIVIYVLGFRLERLIGPAWVIFAFNGWALIRDWRKL